MTAVCCLVSSELGSPAESRTGDWKQNAHFRFTGWGLWTSELFTEDILTLACKAVDFATEIYLNGNNH